MFTLFYCVACQFAAVSCARQLVLGVDGGTESIRACFFDAKTGDAVGRPCAVPYDTEHPRPGWAEQNPLDWYGNLGVAVRGAVRTVRQELKEDFSIISMAVDTTCCSVVALDEDMEPLRPCLLWMDQRAHAETRHILEKCIGDPALDVNGGGEGPLSAEWMLPKCLWIRKNEPQVWAKAATICEYQDYINYKLTGNLCASTCNAATRWHWDGSACEEEGKGRPLSLYQTLGVPELVDKLPRRCLPMGTIVGQLTKDASEHLGLPKDLLVIQGGPDAFVGMVGLGCIKAGQMCLITGSSHLHCVVTSNPMTAKGTWGAYKSCPLPGIHFAEGGQSSTGSVMRWLRNLFGGSMLYSELDEEAATIAPGSAGLVALETFQGQRTPVTDPLARGALIGLTLSHNRAHIWRAFLEAVCFGTRACMEALETAGHQCNEIILAGGITHSPLWLQMHADITDKPIVVCENSNAPLLGCAILASVGAGVYTSATEGVECMVRVATRIDPSPTAAQTYARLYNDVYSKVPNAVRPVSHACSK
jgi:ribulose kinase